MQFRFVEPVEKRSGCMKDICIDWCEATDCRFCKYNYADDKERENAYYNIEKEYEKYVINIDLDK